MVRAVLFLLAIVCTSGCSRDGGHPLTPLGRFTGAPARVVWVQSPDAADPLALGRDLVLHGMDSADGRERRLLERAGSVIKPMLTPRGDRVVYSRARPEGDHEIMMVGWTDGRPASLGGGFALAVWQHPDDGGEWIYAGTDAASEPRDFRTIVRFPIADPGAREVVWSQTFVSADTFQVSADGGLAAGLFPWPEAGVANLQTGRFTRLGDGCWTALSIVRGPLMWYFDGAHRNLTLVDVRTERRWTVNINGVPGFGNDEVYHPRWSNHARFMAISGPYNLGGDNQVRSGGAQTEIYIGRFAPDYSKVEAWLRVTENAAADFYPDVWIDRRASPHAVAASTVGPAVTTAAGSERGATASGRRVVVDATLKKAPAIPTPASIQPYRNALVVHEYEVTSVAEGDYRENTVIVAHWVIRDGEVLPDARREAGRTMRLTLEPFDAHPELEGERLISAGDTPGLPLYYAVRAP